MKYNKRSPLSSRIRKYNFRMYDIRLLIYVIALSIIGVLVIGSAADGFITKQIV